VIGWYLCVIPLGTDHAWALRKWSLMQHSAINYTQASFYVHFHICLHLHVWRHRATRAMFTGTVAACRSFSRVGSTVTLRGEILRKIGDGYHPNECRQACLNTTEFVCAAAQMQLPATCFVTGYRLRNDYASDHYTRTCESGEKISFEKENWLWIGNKISVV